MPIDFSQPGANLSPTELVGFEQQRMQLRRGTREGLANIDFDRGMNQLRRRRSVRDLTRTFNRRREGIDASFANRGLLNSGIRQRAETDLTDAFRRGRGNLRFEHRLVGQQLNRQESQLERQLRLGLADIALLQQALQAQNAANQGVL